MYGWVLPNIYQQNRNLIVLKFLFDNWVCYIVSRSVVVEGFIMLYRGLKK